MLLLAALAAMLFLVEPVIAQRNLNVAAAPANEQRVALVIGNSAYKDAPLPNPVNDAADIAKALQDAGFKVILKRNASTRDMRQAIREFGGELRRAQVGLFYFAGHGIQVKGANYLVPVGADIQVVADAEDLAFDANYALRTMEEAQVKVSIVILDACRNNPF
ncbi:MAG: caspase family protein, partial [Dehalococcoidia bacterium]|nr:caspase family protein [Dehalococcoidia bacterium]